MSKIMAIYQTFAFATFPVAETNSIRLLAFAISYALQSLPMRKPVLSLQKQHRRDPPAGGTATYLYCRAIIFKSSYVQILI
jgi:hypothetical protein